MLGKVGFEHTSRARRGIRMAKKPTGILGSNKLTVKTDGTVSHSLEKIVFPKEKDAVEVLIVSDFISSMNMLMSQ